MPTGLFSMLEPSVTDRSLSTPVRFSSRRMQGALILLLALPILLVGVAVLPRFDGLYGQDPFAYYDYATGPLRSALLALQLPPPFTWPPGYPLLVALASFVCWHRAASRTSCQLAGRRAWCQSLPRCWPTGSVEGGGWSECDRAAHGSSLAHPSLPHSPPSSFPSWPACWPRWWANCGSPASWLWPTPPAWRPRPSACGRWHAMVATTLPDLHRWPGYYSLRLAWHLPS